MARQKMAFFIGRLNRGGAETLLLDILDRWEELPFDALCVYREEGNMSEWFHQTGARLIKLPRKRSWLLYCYRMRKLLRSEGIGIVHSQTSLNAIISIICTAFTSIKVVHTFHGFGFAQASKVVRKVVFRRCHKLVFVSKYEMNYYLERGDFGQAKKCTVVYNGISFDKFGFVPMPVGEQRPINLCMVGSFGSGRNHLFVCKFLNLLKERGVPYNFTFWGAARDSEREVFENCHRYCIEHGLMGNVNFAGISNEIPRSLLSMDAFIYSTNHDSFGIAVIEAIASGLPTFVNNWGVMKELTEDGKYAELYPTDDLEGLYSVFLDFTKNRKAYWIKAHNGAMEIRKRYDISNHIKELNDLYNR